VSDPTSWAVPLAMLAGTSFSLMGIAYRAGAPRGATASHIMVVIAAVGTAVFGARCMGLDLSAVPKTVWAWGLVAGCTQYLTLKFISAGLRIGSLSTVWCAVMLSFVAVILYAAAYLHEPLRWYHWASVMTALGCVAVGSLREHAPADTTHPILRRPAGKLIYGLLLLGLWGLNSVTPVGMKALSFEFTSDGQRHMDLYGDLYRLMIYGILLAALGIEFGLRRRFGAPLLPTLLLGAMAAAGSMMGMTALGYASAGNAALVAPANGVTSIVLTAVVAVVAFGDKADGVWLGTISLGVASAVLANLPTLAAIAALL